eukprot:CAMPEP_0185022112 /NCGR_PEP_ID=MMETSP1103-20130426/4839_1 /TAXON_ID=36769 /ORGANISM="Paraphysomonas bandaiensis, Strain Caron Lab Isolate" /LENGTH=1362 /DNA_ID=CAMNT_0027554057 /DNA_START=11 /DNA_END=4100 /DNA_ORIENTATION=+
MKSSVMTKKTATTTTSSSSSSLQFNGKNETNIGLDFNNLAKEVGYIRARQMFKQQAVRVHQQKINGSDKKTLAALRPERLKATIELSMTYGSPSIENEIDKMMECAQRPGAVIDKAGKTAEEIKQINREFDGDLSVRRSLMNEELIISQMDMDHFPVGMGDTICLQLSHMKRLECARNNFTGLLTEKLPQISAYNIRYIESLNLGDNQLVRLCPDVGMMTNLRVINLANNNLRNLPSALCQLQKLERLNLANNNLALLSDDFGDLKVLEELNLAGNQIFQLPVCFTKLKTLKRLDVSQNCLVHLAMLPRHMTTEEMWHKTQDEFTAKIIYVNILTKERCSNYKKYSGEGIARLKALHMYQPIGSLDYKKRRIWLSICQTYEWEPVLDEESGSLYYRNNVSGDTQWEMPECLDLLGNMEALEYLNVSDNTLKSCAQSLSNIVTLREFHCDNNRLHALPEDIGRLTSLEVLSMKSNELDGIPASIVDCQALKRLVLKDNHIRRLPPELGTLKCLEKLVVSANCMKTLPFSLGFCKSLVEILCVDNPLEDPPYIETIKGMDTLMWYLRQRYHIEKHGMPPPMRYQTLGLNEEVVELYPEFKQRVRSAIEWCQNSHEMNLQLMGLRDIPREILKIGGIKELRLDQNHNLKLPNGFPSELKTVTLLSMRNCALVDIPLNISVLMKLKTIDFQENSLTSIPHTISRLKRLTKLDVSKNRLYELMKGLGALEHLSFLDVDSNCISQLPSDLTSCKSLSTLNCARNRIMCLPSEYCTCFQRLRRLNIEGNRLRSLPAEIKDMKLEVLRCGYNYIEWLPEDMFEGSLGQTIKLFSIPENNLLELPISVKAVLDQNLQLQAEFNPLVSPPLCVLAEGFKIVQAYMRVRAARLVELDKLLLGEDFLFVKEYATPLATEVLEDGTGFLTPFDLMEFDAAVDEYLNGELYLCPASGREIVSALVKLRDARESELYLEVLNATHKAIEMCINDENYNYLYGPAVITSAKRPWGRKGEMCGCYVVSLHALLRDTPPNKTYQPDGRAAMIKLIADCMPHTTFPFTVELLKDSLRLYLSPYGQVADTEVMTFSGCDCIDERRRKPLYHDPCEKPAVVLMKLIYTDDEARRRDDEEYLFNSKFEEIENEIRLWMSTSEGYKLLNKQIASKKASVVEDIELREEMRKIEMYKERQAISGLDKVNVRIKQFEQGLDFDIHHILSHEDAQKLKVEAEKRLAKQKKRVEAVENSLDRLEELRSMDRRGLRRMLTQDLIKKYCHLYYAEKIKELRKEAIRKNWRRPWDGEDGAEFERVRNRLLASALASGTEDIDVDALVEDENNVKPNEMKEDGEAEEDEYKPEFDWNDTEDMTKYDSAMFIDI